MARTHSRGFAGGVDEPQSSADSVARRPCRGLSCRALTQGGVKGNAVEDLHQSKMCPRRFPGQRSKYPAPRHQCCGAVALQRVTGDSVVARVFGVGGVRGRPPLPLVRRVDEAPYRALTLALTGLFRLTPAALYARTRNV